MALSSHRNPVQPAKTEAGVYYLVASDRAVGPEATRGAMEVARRGHGNDLVMKSQSKLLHYLMEPEILGVLMCTYEPAEIDFFKSESYPTVNLSNLLGPLPEMGNLLSDDREVGRMAARHLLKQGHRSFLTVWYEGRHPHHERALGFMEVIQDSGHTVVPFTHSFEANEDIHKTHMSYLRGMQEVVASALGNIPLGSGIFASNDHLALLIQQVMYLFYPEHLETSGILGVDNDAPSFGYLGSLPELSSVQPAFYQMGVDAMDWLFKHPGIRGREVAGDLFRLYPPTGVIARASTAAGACADPLTARMIRWIWERVREGQAFSVSDVARAHHMARKTLERRFAEHANTSPGDLISRLRLDLVREMLRNTSTGIAEISLRCGFSKQDILARAFRREYGCTPSEYRRRVREAPPVQD